MQAVIVAGGRGSRLALGEDDLPKPIALLAGLPMLDHLVGRLTREGVTDVVVCTGFRAEQIERALGDGARHGVRIRYSRESAPLGTAGAVKGALALLEERFLVAYADVLFDVDLAKMARAHAQSGAAATLAVHPNDHPFDSDRVVTDHLGRVARLVPKGEAAGAEAGALANAALYLIEREALAAIADGPADFASDLFPALLRAGRPLHAYRTVEYLKDMGTAERRARVEEDLARGVPSRMRLAAGRRSLLCDRDGVLIEDHPFIHRADQIAVLPGVGAALARLNRAGVLAVVCTNQPVLARGALDEEGLHRLHLELEGRLGAEGAWLDGILVCPHHPERGFAGERADLKRACECRKPAPGLLHQAEAAFGVDRRASLFAGDRTTDLEAARAAGYSAVGVLTGSACRDGKHPLRPETPLVPSFSEAVALLLETVPSWAGWLERVRDAQVVLIGGPSRAGKTLAAEALKLALGQAGVEAVRLSLDRFIRPRSERRGESARERLGLEPAAQALASLLQHRVALVPGYHPYTRERAPSEIIEWSGRGVLIVDGILANALEAPGALQVALEADAELRRARRRAFYRWKGVAEGELEEAVAGRRDEELEAAALGRRAALTLRLRDDFRLEEIA